MKYFNIKALAMLVTALILFSICFGLAKGTDTNTADSSTAYNIASWLSKNDVFIDRAMIDINDNYIISSTMTNTLSDKDSSARTILNGNTESAADTYTGPNGTLTFSRDKFTLKPSAETFKDEFADVSVYNAGKRAETAAKLMGFDLNGSLISTSYDDTFHYAVITKTIDERPVFDDAIIMTFDKTGLKSMEGVWYTVYGGYTKSRLAKPCIDALAEFLDHVPDGQRVTITSVTLGYNMKHSGNITEIFPVWRIESDCLESIYIDA